MHRGPLQTEDWANPRRRRDEEVRSLKTLIIWMKEGRLKFSIITNKRFLAEKQAPYKLVEGVVESIKSHSSNIVQWLLKNRIRASGKALQYGNKWRQEVKRKWRGLSNVMTPPTHINDPRCVRSSIMNVYATARLEMTRWTAAGMFEMSLGEISPALTSIWRLARAP